MNKKVKVLYISPNGYLGGAERFVLNALVGHRESERIEASVLFFNDGDLVKKLDSLGVKTHVIPFQFKLSSPLSLLKALQYIRKYVRQEGIQIIQPTMAYGQLVSSLATLFLDVKNAWFQHGPVGGLLDKLASLLPYDLMFLNSKYLQNEQNKTISLSEPRYGQKIINYSVLETESDQSTVNEIRSNFLKEHKSIFILCAGRICSWKGYHTAIKSFELLKQHNPDYFKDSRMMILGSAMRESDKEYEDYLHSLVKEFNLEDHVIFESFKENIHDYYRACDIFIHASTIPEPFGLVVAEAQRCGSFVIGSNAGGVRDILIDGETGLSFNAVGEDEKELHSKLCDYFLMSDEKRDSLARNGERLIKTEYSEEQMISDIEGVYSSMI